MAYNDDYLTVFGIAFVCFGAYSILVGQMLVRFGWEDCKSTRFIRSCTVAVLHGGVVPFLALKQLIQQDYQLDAPNQQEQLRIMAYSSGYFCMDTIYLLLYLREEIAYLVHHIVTITYMQSCIYVGYGGFSVMVLMFVGEITNPLHNAFLILDEVLKLETPPKRALQLFAVVTPAFHLLYAIVR
jgi:hypothetical protein